MDFFKVHTNKGERDIAVSNCWIPNGERNNPMTTRQYQEGFIHWDQKDLVKLFSILSGLSVKVLYETHDYVLEEQLRNATDFVYTEPMDFKDYPIPHWIEIDGKQVRVPMRVGGLGVGQTIHAIQAIQNIEKYKYYEELISFVTAMYLQPIYDNSEFDYHRAMELEQKILDLPIAKTYQVGFFLLKKLMPSGKNTISNVSHQIAHLLKGYIRKGKV